MGFVSAPVYEDGLQYGDAQAQLLVKLAFERLIGQFMALHPATGQAPPVRRVEDMLDEQHFTLLVQHDAYHARREASARPAEEPEPHRHHPRRPLEHVGQPAFQAAAATVTTHCHRATMPALYRN